MNAGAKWRLSLAMLGEASRRFFARRNRHTGNALIVRCDRLGDMMIQLPYLVSQLEYLKRRNCRATLLLAPGMGEFLRGVVDFDEVIELDMKRFLADFAYRKERLRRIREGKFELLFNSRIAREFFVDDAVALAAGAGKSMALYSPDRGVNVRLTRWGNFFYTKIFRLPATCVSEDSADAFFHRNAFPEAAEAKWDATDARDLRGEGSGDGGDGGGEKRKKKILVFPGAGDDFRRWGNANFARVVVRLAAKHPEYAFAVCGTRGETGLCDDLAKRCRERGVEAENLAGKIPLSGLAGLVGEAALVIGNDSGCVHLAAYCGVPAAAAAGGGHYGRFVPYPDDMRFSGVVKPAYAVKKLDCFCCNWACSRSERFACLRGVTPEEVASLAEDQLAVLDEISHPGVERHRDDAAEKSHP